jgi:hypothetical protein
MAAALRAEGLLADEVDFARILLQEDEEDLDDDEEDWDDDEEDWDNDEDWDDDEEDWEEKVDEGVKRHVDDWQ